MDSEAPPPHRRSIRLSTYDYAQGGAYFITICAHRRRCLFGRVVDSRMQMNALGAILEEEWFRSPTIRRIILDAFIVMPNHLHGIVVLESARATSESVGATGRSPEPLSGPSRASLGSFIGSFKAAATRRIKALARAPDAPVWQRNYYEHIIRDDRDLAAIREYIDSNPANWTNDRENPEAVKPSKPIAAWAV